MKNGDRWHVLSVRDDGSIEVRRHRPAGYEGESLRLSLPADYVAEHIQLGYASTIHSAQGATVDTTHTILSVTETRQSLYVALSRGSQENHLYLSDQTATDVDMLAPERADAVDLTADPRQVLTDILDRDGRARSATTVERGDAAELLRAAVLAYQDALPILAQAHLGQERMGALDARLESWRPGLTEAPGYPHLRGQLALGWVRGTTPREAIERATIYTGGRSLEDAEDPAALLSWRVSATSDQADEEGPLAWLPSIPHRLKQDPATGD